MQTKIAGREGPWVSEGWGGLREQKSILSPYDSKLRPCLRQAPIFRFTFSSSVLSRPQVWGHRYLKKVRVEKLSGNIHACEDAYSPMNSCEVFRFVWCSLESWFNECMSFPGQLQQITIYLVTESNRNLFSHRIRGQNGVVGGAPLLPGGASFPASSSFWWLLAFTDL